ncbi:MAG: UPF0182 family protein [Anaerolineae bacterium]
MNSNTRRTGFIISGVIVLAALLLGFSSSLVGLYTEWLWFRSLDFVPILTTRIWTQVALVTVSILIAVGFLIVNWSLLPYHLFPQKAWHAKVRGKPIEISTKPLRLIFTLAALGIGLIFGLTMIDEWRAYLLAREGTAFGLSDPIFNLDVGFYVFDLPWYETLLSTSTTLVGLTTVGLLLRYAMVQQIRSRQAVAHLSALGALWLLLLAVGRWFERYQLLQSDLDGVVFGAGYTDVHARQPFFILQAAVFVVAAALLIVNAFTRRFRLLALAGVAWLALSLLGGLYPAAVQQFRVEPNEFAVERPYIEHNIEFTRYAYGLDQIGETQYPATGTITEDDLEAKAEVLQNVRLWDYRPLQRTYSQLQEIRLYYHFNDVDIDRYVLDGELRQVTLAARELEVEQLADRAQTWINRHLIFTHGYGVALNAVGEVTSEGLPRLLVRDIPPVAAAPELALTRPEIYFGESTHQYIVVNTTEDEFDYPAGDTNAYTRYTGPDGVPLNNLLRRALLALRFNSVQLLISPAVRNESRILFHRTIQDRAQTIAPMLWYDPDPYLVLHKGRLVWLMDAYTWTNRFPYSEPTSGVNYVRNSVKVTVDAYTGEIHFYLIDPQDPIAATYARIFPDLFTPVSEVPATLKAHWRYPETLFLIQSQMLSTYHMEDPQVFYNREDLWDIPQEIAETEQKTVVPYYMILQLPGAEAPEFMLIRPYVPNEKQNMVAWLYADSDGEDYGTLGIYKMPKDRLVYGPLQIEGRISQDPLIAQQISLWDQRGSQVVRGNLLVLPINETFLYIEPLYLESASGQLPELTRVIVAYADHIAMAPTLEEALLQVLSGQVTAEPEGSTPGVEANLQDLAQQAWERYQAAQACLQAGDWICYGQEQAALEELLRKMVQEKTDQ